MKRSIIALAALAGLAAHAAVGRQISLAEGDTPGVVRFISQAIELADGAKQSWVTITRTGDFSDPRYGDFKITPTHLDQMVSNFNNRVLGQDVFLDVAHRPSDGAAGKFVKLAIEGTRLRGLVEWTPFGMDAVKTRGFAYLSAEYHEQWKDNEKQMAHGCVLLGAGLTTRPVIKNLDPVTLSLDDSDHAPDVRVAISSQLLKELSEQSTMEKYLKMLSAFLSTLGFTDVTGKPFNDLLSLQLAAVKDDDAKCLAAVENVKTMATSAMDQLKKLGGDPQTVNITLSAPGAAAPDVAGEVTRVLAARDAANAAATTALSAKVKLLSDTIAEGDKSLTPEGVKKFSDDFAPLITAVTTDEQVKHLASLAINQAKQLSAAQKLAGLGYNPAAGNIQITVEGSNSIKALQETIDKRLGFEGMPDHQRYAKTGGKLLAGNKAFAEKALAQFDAANGRRLAEEHKALAAGTGLISDVSVPVVAERTVLREALYNLVSLQFMDLGTAEFANVITIPYSYRDTTGAGVSGLRRYEGQGVRRAGVIQTSDEARPIPQKLAF
ncbi:MAG: phage protease, partial [Hylemonella sp.]